MYYNKDVIETVKKIPALEYLQEHEPGAIFRKGNTFFLREHDSLYFSNGMWRWSSQGIGGSNALQFLQKVYGMSFTDAMQRLCDCYGIESKNKVEDLPKRQFAKPIENTEKILKLPAKDSDNKRVFAYLRSRGISAEVLRYFIKEKMIYQDKEHANCVFVGYDDEHKPRYAGLRGSNSFATFRGDAPGSDKNFSFRNCCKESKTVHIFEAPIDLLSYATYMELKGYDFRKTNLLSVAGIVKPRKDGTTSIPAAIANFFEGAGKNVTMVCIHFDNDDRGLEASEAVAAVLYEKGYDVKNLPVPAEYGKDVNDFLLKFIDESKEKKLAMQFK